MKRSVAVLLTLFLTLQLWLPVQAAQVQPTPELSASSESGEDTSDLPESPVEEEAAPDDPQPEVIEDLPAPDVEEPEDSGTVLPEEEPDTVLPEEDLQEEHPEEVPEAPDSEEEPVSPPAEPEQEGEESALEEEQPVAEEDTRLYNGQEADYEDPQFLKLLSDGFFDTTRSSVTYAATGSSHSSRFEDYNIQKGVDISKWNEITSWSNLAKSVDFAIIRCGYRSTKGDKVYEDPKFHENMTAALAAGLDVGIYVYSQATTVQEAREEAELALRMCKGYSFTLPIVIDYEYYGEDGYLYNAHLSDAQRTQNCRAFCEVIEAAGYTPMIYANKSMLLDDMDGESLAESGYEIWLAHWVAATDYPNTYTYWQYTDRGTVSGIRGYVDANYRYELPEATLSNASCVSNGVRLRWNPVSAADQYRIYRKTEGASTWTQIASVSGTTQTYLDETAVKDVSYRYTVQACDGNVRAAFDRTGIKITYVPQISISSAKMVNNGVQLTWENVNDYDGFKLYRRQGTNGSWIRIADITDPKQNSYLDTEITTHTASGVFSYTIRGVKNGTLSSYDPYGVQITCLSTPVLLSAGAREVGISVSWKAVSGADGYYIYRRINNKWSKIATVKGETATSYVDKSATTVGASYTYTVVAYHDSQRSAYDTHGITALQLETPTLVSATVRGNAIQVTWNVSHSAEVFRVYRKSGSGNWVILSDVRNTTTYLDKDTETGVKYTYTVRAMNAGCLSWYDAKGVSALLLATPAPTTPARSSDTSVKLSWPAVEGAVRYQVYRKTTGSWKLLGSVAANSYSDAADLVSGTTYYYTVRAYDASGNASAYLASGVRYDHLATPALNSLTVKSNGLELSWTGISGANTYTVYRKQSGTSWVRIATVSHTVNRYTDTTAASGTTYFYTVRAYSKAGSSWYDTKGRSSTYLSTPKLSSLTQNGHGLTLSWKEVSGASHYFVYRRDPQKGWVQLTSVTGTSYVDKTAFSSGTLCRYTVRANNGKYLSGYDTKGISCLYLPTPSIRSAANVDRGVQFSWNAVTGASSYAIYRKTSGTGWTRLGTTTKTTYTDTQAASGTVYTYTVRAIAQHSMSGYVTAGKSCLRLASPKLLSVSQTTAGMKLTWEKLSTPSVGYAVFRKTAGTGWQQLGRTSGNSYVDTTPLDNGHVYIYTVRSYQGNIWGSYSYTGISIQRLATPNLDAPVNEAAGIQVSWTPVDGAEEYMVYRKINGSGWIRLGICSDSSYCDTTAVEGVTYAYTVRARSDLGFSLYDPAGVRCTRSSPA